MTLTELILFGLALNLILETWHHSSLTAGRRATIELYDTWWSELLSCMYCLAHWLGLGLIVVCYCLPVFLALDPSIVVWCRAPVYWLATVRTAHLLNDLLYRFNRTPKF